MHPLLNGRLRTFLYLGLWVGIIFTLIAPSYMLQFFRDPAGKIMLVMAVVMQVVGFLWIRRVINIKV